MNKIFPLFTFFLLFSSLSSQDFVKLTFAGDLMAHDVNYRTSPLSDIYKGVSDILLNDDLSFINLEFPVDENRRFSSYPSFNVHPSYIEAAIKGGFDVFSLGNNHTNDFGYNSVVQTVINMDKFKNSDYITYSGVYGKNETEFRVESIQIKTLNIGFIGITQFSNNNVNTKGANKIYTADYNNVEQANKLKRFIQSVAGDYDCLILGYHGGAEYRYNPSPARVKFFDNLIESGVDIIWAHHPHVLQPWKHYSTESGDKLIMYSMGNFISGQLAIVDPIEHDINFAATGFSSLFNVDIFMEDNKLIIKNAEPIMTANIRNENNYFVSVKKEVALDYPMDENWKGFYTKMFPIAEDRIRKQ